jgi:hypothetical protein
MTGLPTARSHRHGELRAGPSEEPQIEQLNLKLDNKLMDALKARAYELRRPYHSLVREWIEEAIVREEEALGLDPVEADNLRSKT